MSELTEKIMSDIINCDQCFDINQLQVIREILSSTFRQPEPDSDSQPKWDITPPKDNEFKCQQCGCVYELGPWRLVRDEPWTAEPPSVEGWYWWKDDHNGPLMTKVFMSENTSFFIGFDGKWKYAARIGGLWQGPLKPSE